MEYREIRRVMAKASLQQGWLLAEEAGQEAPTDEEIDREIEAVRRAQLQRRSAVAEDEPIS